MKLIVKENFKDDLLIENSENFFTFNFKEDKCFGRIKTIPFMCEFDKRNKKTKVSVLKFISQDSAEIVWTDEILGKEHVFFENSLTDGYSVILDFSVVK